MIKVPAISHRQSGAILLELAVSIPVLLLMAFFALWFAIVQNLQAQLNYVVTNAPFLALSRGNIAFYDDGVGGGPDAGISIINDFMHNPPPSLPGDLPRALAFSSKGSTALLPENPIEYYNGNGATTWAITSFDADGIPSFATDPLWGSSYAKYLNAHLLAIAYEGLHLGVGNTLSYPCSPSLHPGCARCAVVAPATSDYWTVDPPMLQLICAASPPEPFHSLFKAGMRLFGGDDVPNPVLSAATYPNQTGTGGSGPIG